MSTTEGTKIDFFTASYGYSQIISDPIPEAAPQRCSWEKVFWKYAANLQEKTHAEVRFQ